MKDEQDAGRRLSSALVRNHLVADAATAAERQREVVQRPAQAAVIGQTLDLGLRARAETMSPGCPTRLKLVRTIQAVCCAMGEADLEAGKRRAGQQ